MRLLLRPVSPGLGEIRVEKGFLAIGRGEPPFDSYAPELAESLSPRHARIFAENESAYVIDLGSRNGTTVNGQPVTQQPVVIHSGDEVSFSGKLAYRIETFAPTDQDTVIAPELAIRLSLVPKRADHGLEVIVVSQFPFLVSKSEGVFSHYRERFPKDLDFISRRHAHIYRQGDQLYVEDLGSTNGTYIGGTRLRERAVALRHGDAISFGQHHFVYDVQLEAPTGDGKPTLTEAPVDLQRRDRSEPPRPEQPRSEQPRPEQPMRTTFVSTAGSFLDIYCAEDEPDKPGATIRDGKHVPGNRGAAAPANREPHRARWMWLTAGICTLVIAGSLGWYFRDDTRNQVESLVAKGEYVKGLSIARTFLNDHPGDERMTALATEALLKHVVPPWTRAIDNNQFAKAQRVLAGASELSLQKDTAEFLELLGWVGGLQRYAARHEPQDPIRLFGDDARIKALLQWWNADSEAHATGLGHIASDVSEFEAVRAQVFSQVRNLGSDRAVYVDAMEVFKKTIRQYLDSGRARELEPIFNEFQSDYPRIAGVQRLEADLNHYLVLNGHIQARDLEGYTRLLDEFEFKTPPFRHQLEQLKASALPPADVVEEYHQATQAWRAGEVDQAMAILTPLTEAVWGELATRRLTRYQAVSSDFESLMASQDSEAYPHELIAFYAGLDTSEDAFLRAALKEDFERYESQALIEAKESIGLAQQHWHDYRDDDGGIGGALRLEASLSDAFRERANLLSEAYEHIARCVGVYELLGSPYPPEAKALYERVVSEVKRQRTSLDELRIVLESELVNEKISLLPQPQERMQ